MKNALRRRFSIPHTNRERTKSEADELEAFKPHATFDFDEPPPDDDLSTDKNEEMLRKFREGGRFEYKQEQRNYFEIKYWYFLKKISVH